MRPPKRRFPSPASTKELLLPLSFVNPRKSLLICKTSLGREQPTPAVAARRFSPLLPESLFSPPGNFLWVLPPSRPQKRAQVFFFLRVPSSSSFLQQLARVVFSFNTDRRPFFSFTGSCRRRSPFTLSCPIFPSRCPEPFPPTFDRPFFFVLGRPPDFPAEQSKPPLREIRAFVSLACGVGGFPSPRLFSSPFLTGRPLFITP